MVFCVMDGTGSLEELEAVVVSGNYLAKASDHVTIGGEVPAWVKVVETIGDGVEVMDGLGSLGVRVNEGGHECIQSKKSRFGLFFETDSKAYKRRKGLPHNINLYLCWWNRQG